MVILTITLRLGLFGIYCIFVKKIHNGSCERSESNVNVNCDVFIKNKSVAQRIMQMRKTKI